MLKVALERDVLVFGKGFALDFQRTSRIPDDGKTYPLPPGLGTFPLRRIEDYRERVPRAWVEHGGVFIPVYQREALWISFLPRYWKPNAVKIAVGKVNAVSGKPWDERIRSGENDYLVCPPQPWLDGINAGDEYIRQFVAMPLGMGYTVEGQVTGAETFGGIQIVVYEPKPGRFRDQPPTGAVELVLGAVKGLAEGAAMGLAAGGKMKQKLYSDPYGIDTWDEENYGRIFVHIVNSMMYREITGNEPPPTPVTARMYAEHGLPWFDVYDDAICDLSASAVLSKVKPVKEIDKEKGFTSQQDDGTVSVPEENIIHYKLDLDDAGDDGDS